MSSFEDFGREVDREIERLKNYVQTEVMPKGGRRGAEILRAASRKLAGFAAELDRLADTPANPSPSTTSPGAGAE